MTEKLLKEFKWEIAGLRLVPSDGGRFEVSINGELVYSKLKTGRFPEYGEVQKFFKKKR